MQAIVATRDVLEGGSTDPAPLLALRAALTGASTCEPTGDEAARWAVVQHLADVPVRELRIVAPGLGCDEVGSTDGVLSVVVGDDSRFNVVPRPPHHAELLPGPTRPRDVAGHGDAVTARGWRRARGAC
jgi:hypothetical protein